MKYLFKIIPLFVFLFLTISVHSQLEFPEDITGIVNEIVITERNTSYFEVPEIESS